MMGRQRSSEQRRQLSEKINSRCVSVEVSRSICCPAEPLVSMLREASRLAVPSLRVALDSVWRPDHSAIAADPPDSQEGCRNISWSVLGTSSRMERMSALVILKFSDHAVYIRTLWFLIPSVNDFPTKTQYEFQRRRQTSQFCMPA